MVVFLMRVYMNCKACQAAIKIEVLKFVRLHVLFWRSSRSDFCESAFVALPVDVMIGKVKPSTRK